MTPEQQGEASLAVLRALIREQQLLEAVQPLDELLDGDPLEPAGHALGEALGQVRANLQQLGSALAPAVAPATAGADPHSEDPADG